jgi:transposase
MSQRRTFDKGFKVMTIERCLSGKPTTEVAKKPDLRNELVSGRKREYQQKKEGSFYGHGKSTLAANAHWLLR